SAGGDDISRRRARPHARPELDAQSFRQAAVQRDPSAYGGSHAESGGGQVGVLESAAADAVGSVRGMREPVMVHKRICTALAGVAMPIGVATSAAAQDPTDAFFDDTVGHEIRLTVSSRDWENLKENFQENTYYQADLRWRDQVVRSIGIRSRGNGSRRP